jgi:cytidylate kinase
MRSVVSISRAAGASGEAVGHAVAERLGFALVDEEIVAEAAAKGGIGPDEVAAEERRRSLVQRVLEAMAEGGASAFALGGALPPHVPDELRGVDVRALIRETIEQIAGRGRVVIVAHAASYALPPGPELLRVLVTASPGTRAERLGASLGLDSAAAARAVKESDAARGDYLKRFYGVDDEAPTRYDLVVNTDVLSVEQAADVIAYAAAD